ncbi:MAG: Lrp/AsnC family transcriptional regulator [Spirochaetia bacterium]|jgi:Lrp/AsnC family leucine-responsive transcriptional regulator|nr:Lrp/AsnC family transcriptional regulator [Spirochaetia bacterium]
MPLNSLDKTDYSILNYLQNNGRASNVQLADHLNLSETPSWRRHKRLEVDGIIKNYQANLDRRKLGFDILAFVQVMFSVHTDDTPEKFEQIIKDVPEILSCHNITGEADYMLVIVSENLETYEKLLRLTLRRLPGVTSIKSNLSMREVKNTASLPLLDSKM